MFWGQAARNAQTPAAEIFFLQVTPKPGWHA